MQYQEVTKHPIGSPLHATARHEEGARTLHETNPGALTALRALGGLTSPKSAVIQVTPDRKPTEADNGAECSSGHKTARTPFRLPIHKKKHGNKAIAYSLSIPKGKHEVRLLQTEGE